MKELMKFSLVAVLMVLNSNASANPLGNGDTGSANVDSITEKSQKFAMALGDKLHACNLAGKGEKKNCKNELKAGNWEYSQNVRATMIFEFLGCEPFYQVNQLSPDRVQAMALFSEIFFDGDKKNPNIRRVVQDLCTINENERTSQSVSEAESSMFYSTAKLSKVARVIEIIARNGGYN